MSRTDWKPETAYNNLPKIISVNELETNRVLKSCIGARAALAELKQATQLLPNPSMLINTLPILEAQASSEIEHIVTTADELFRHVGAEHGASPATREALRYRAALLHGFESLKRVPITTRTAVAVCSQIKGTEMQVRRVPGTKLQRQPSGEIIYTPPEGEARLLELLADWESFLHADDSLDPVIRMAAAHYQFEAIHPFTDGNGRTGRVINSLVLVEQDLLPLPILYLSRFIIRNKAEYYSRLLGVTQSGAWEPWILFMVRGVEETATWTTAKIAAIRELERQAIARMQTELPKIYSRELVEAIFAQPYCRISNLVDAGIAGRQASTRYLRALARIGMVQELAIGKERLFIHGNLMALLTAESNQVLPYR